MMLDVLEFHRRTNHTFESVRRRSRGLDWANQPHPFKRYAGLPVIPLPTPRQGPPELGAGQLTVGALAHVLYYSAGITRVREAGGEPFSFRAYASAGALYPVEVYVVAGELDRLEAGVYHFQPKAFGLAQLRAGDLRGDLAAAAANDPAVSAAPVTLIVTGIPWRTMWKYEARGYRHLYWDSGMVLANLFAVTQPMGIDAGCVLGFVDDAVDRLIGTDGRHEVSLFLVPLGQDSQAPPLSADLPAIAAEVLPLSEREIEFVDALAAHDASRLRSTSEVEQWKSAR